MKKFLSCFLCIVICVGAFASCSKQPAPLSQVYAELTELPNVPSMKIMNDESIEELFGFDLSKFEEYVFAEATDPSVNADRIILIKVRDSADITPVAQVLDGYLSTLKKNTSGYFLNGQKLSSIGVRVAGNVVYLVITAEYFEAEVLLGEMLSGYIADQSAQTAVDLA